MREPALLSRPAFKPADRRRLRGAVGLALAIGLTGTIRAPISHVLADCGSSGNTYWSYAGVSFLEHAALGEPGIYVVAQGGGGSTLSVLDPSTGTATANQFFTAVTLGRPLFSVMRGEQMAVHLCGRDGFVYARNPTTLALAWTLSLRRPACTADYISAAPVIQLYNSSNPTFRAAHNRDILFVGTHYACGTTTANRVYGLDAANGNVEWIFNSTGSSQVDAIHGLCVDYARNQVYVVSDKTALPSQSTVWALSTLTGAKIWSLDLEACEAEPVLAGGRLYVASRAGALYALDPTTGNILASTTVTTTASITVRLAAHVNGDEVTVYVVDSSGRLYTYRDMCSTLTPMWSFKPGSALVSAAPAIFGDYLYVGADDGKVWQVRISDGNGPAYATVAAGVGPSYEPFVLQEGVDATTPRLLARSVTTAKKLCIPWPHTPGDKAVMFPRAPTSELR